MFDFKSMGAIAGLMKNKDQIEAAAQRVKERIEVMRVEGSAGGGAVRAIITGKMRVESIDVDPSVGAGFGAHPGSNEDAKRMAQDLIAQAVNDGLQSAQDEIARLIQAELQDLGIDESVPGLSKLVKGMLPS